MQNQPLSKVSAGCLDNWKEDSEPVPASNTLANTCPVMTGDNDVNSKQDTLASSGMSTY